MAVDGIVRSASACAAACAEVAEEVSRRVSGSYCCSDGDGNSSSGGNSQWMADLKHGTAKRIVQRSLQPVFGIQANTVRSGGSVQDL